MNNKKHKLRLRKQVIVAIPILILMLVLTLAFTLNRNKSYALEDASKNTSLTSPNVNTSDKKFEDLSIVKDISSKIKERQIDNTIIYYASKYKIDTKKALDIAHKYTKNYTDPTYLKTNIIGPKSIINKEGSFKSIEAGVVYYIRDLFRYPEHYGKTIPEIRISEVPSTERTYKNNHIMLDNGLTFEQYLGKICDLYGVNKEIALAITHLETGFMKSNLFKYSNNIGGQRGMEGWMKFTTLESGIINHVLTLKSISNRYGIDLDAPDAINKLSGVYVKGNPTKVAPSWVGKVTNLRSKIVEKDLFTIKK